MCNIFIRNCFHDIERILEVFSSHIQYRTLERFSLAYLYVSFNYITVIENRNASSFI